jgi:glycosyltransferase involved in cell wall biosynthesis
MPMKLKISVLIPTYNEAENLKALLPLLSWAEEIIVVDSFSKDLTVAVAESFDVKVLSRKYDGPAFQKNWAIELATHNWVLIFDADERPTPELCDEIKKHFDNGEPMGDAYRIKRRNFFMGREIRFSGWQNDWVTRLIRKDKCRYKNVMVHEEIECNGKIGQLKSPMLHFTYRDLAHFKAKIERYAKWSALDYEQKTGNISFFHLQLKPAFRFFKHYILKMGFMDGKAGWVISRLMALGVRKRYQYLQQKRKSGSWD